MGDHFNPFGCQLKISPDKLTVELTQLNSTTSGTEQILVGIGNLSQLVFADASVLGGNGLLQLRPGGLIGLVGQLSQE